MNTRQVAMGAFRVLILALTMVVVSLVLVLGRATAEPPIQLVVGQPSPETFMATEQIEVEDEAATEFQREVARNSVAAQYRTAPEADISVRSEIALFFSRARAASEPIPPEEPVIIPSTTTPEPSTTTSVPAEGEETTTTEATTTTTTVPPTTTTTTLPPPPFETQLQTLSVDYGLRLSEGSLATFLSVLAIDDETAGTDEPTALFSAIELEADQIARGIMDRGIQARELDARKDALLAEPPAIFVTGLPDELREPVRLAVAELVADVLQANRTRALDLEEEERERLASIVPPVIRTYQQNETIVEVGDILTQPAVDAISELGLLEPVQTESRLAMASVASLMVLLIAFFVWRIARRQWTIIKHFGLLGVLLILAAIVARIPDIVTTDANLALAFVMPATALGYLAAILYDPRTAVLMSIPAGAFTAIATGDAGLTLFAAGSTVIPVGLVSSASTRRELRLAVAYAAILTAPLAAAVAWLFGTPGEENLIRDAALYGFAGSIVAGLVAQGLLSFLETAFRVTTTSTLLDLTDRNHPALRLLEEKAPGTFNHSIMVGTLASRAARAIGADPLLAEAAAYYHDLGKTENPQYFIENQFGVSNPHDDLPPEQSALIIRNHVTDGLRLARQYRIPQDVAQGILMHHGDGLMRCFYHKAQDTDPGIDPSLYRHHGQRPERREMAIIMLADAVEGATRAMVQHEDPTPDSLRKLVDQIVAEKVDDGQLDRSDLTYGDLTNVKEALVESLIGYYHTRIAYPGFPSREVSPP